MGKNRGYKRRWRNLLLDRKTQLSFTSVLVGIAAVLMVALGWWVKEVANSATQVAVHSVVETRCPPDPDENPAAVPTVLPNKPAGMDEVRPDDGDADDADNAGDADDASDEAAAGDEVAAADKEATAADADADKADDKADDKAAAAADQTDQTGDSEGDETGEPPRAKVILEESHLEEIEPTVDVAALRKMRAAYHRCRDRQERAKAHLWSSYRLILYVLAAATVFLIFGLGFYGIKMTHKVAGPLYKVGLYLDKMAGGLYDTVYNLRKGDQLGEFYEHFRAAHAGLVRMQREDIAVLEEAVGALEEALAEIENPPADLQQAVAELAEVLAEKKSNLKVEEKGNG